MSDFLKLQLIVEGIDETIVGLDQWDQQAINAAEHAMVENTEDLLGKSMRIVPHDEGMLEGSGSAQIQGQEVAHGTDDGKMTQTGAAPAVFPGVTITGEVSYNKPYAARQHEELGYRHKEGRQAKYLETPLKGMVKNYAKNIADAIKDVKK